MTSNHLKTSLYTLAATVMLLSSSQNHAQQYYKWVDASGSTHYTATPPPKGAKRLDAFAVVGDRAWMTDSQNHTYTVYVGQKMPDNRTVYAADENEQAIWVK